MDAEAANAALRLGPHPEGGHFREIYRHDPGDGGRGLLTSIYYLLRAGEESRWHRVTDAVEVWNFHDGDPLELALGSGSGVERHRLGNGLEHGERPQVFVPAGVWQSARSLGAWTLVGCTVAPAFSFDAFELAAPGWEPAG